jgi:hypothetical protein
MNPPTPATTRPARRWLRFSLRSLLILMTAMAVWLGFTMKRLRDQEQAVARIQELGGTVTYHYQLDENGNWISDAQPPGPRWLRAILGPHWGVHFMSVFVSFADDNSATDRDVNFC